MIGKRLREYRIARGLTQEDLANRVNRTQQTISLYESDDRMPDVETLIQIALVLDVSLDNLTGLTDERESPKVPLSTFIDILPEDLAEFVRKQGNHQWAVLSRRMREHDLSPEEVAQIIEMVLKLKEYTESREREKKDGSN